MASPRGLSVLGGCPAIGLVPLLALFLSAAQAWADDSTRVENPLPAPVLDSGAGNVPPGPGIPLQGDFKVQPPASTHPQAVLRIENREIAVFRAPFMGHRPEQRIDPARRNIRKILVQRDSPMFNASPIPQGLAIRAGEVFLFVLVPEDVDLLSGETLEQCGERAVARLGEARAAWKAQRSLSGLMWGIGQTALATIVVILLLRILRTVERRLRSRFAELASHGLGHVEKTGLTLIDRNRALRATGHATSILVWIVRLLILFAWVTFALSRFPYTAPWGRTIGRGLADTAGDLAVRMLHAIPGLVTVLLILVITRFLVGLVRLVFSSVESGQLELPWIERDVAAPSRRLLVLLLWLGAAVMIYPYLPGSDSLAFKGVGLLFGLMASLGGSRLVGQAMSGFVVMFSRALRAGEYVRIGEVEGTVASVNVLTVKIRTPKNEEVTIPSSLVVDNMTKNYSRLASVQDVMLYTSVTIGYNAPWRQVHALLVEAAARTPGLKKTPAPFVHQTALSDFFVEYQLNAAIEDPSSRVAALTALHANIQDVFNEHGVQIMSPHYETDPAEKVWVPKEKWFEKPAAGPAGSREST